MSKKQGHLKDDDFWNDCFRDPNVTKNILHKQNIRRSLIKSQAKLIQEILNEDAQRHKRIKEASKHCYTLYNQCFMRNEIIKTMANNKKKRYEEEELSNCTWKPKLICKSSYDLKLKKYSNMQIYNRGVFHIQKHNENIAKCLYTKSLEEQELTFQPRITCGYELNSVFQIAYKTPFERDSNKYFLCRYHKARVEEDYKKARLITDLSRVIGRKWKKRGIKRSISAKDSCIFKQTLHDNLLSLENNYQQ